MLRRLLLASTAVCAMSGAAFAADLPARVEAPAPYIAAVPIFTWTGFYVGFSGGGVWQRNRWDATSAFGPLPAPEGALTSAPENTSAGATYTGQIGYNWQMGANWVLGIEADISGAGAGSSEVLHQTTNLVGDPAEFRSSLDYFGTVRGRLGYAFDRSLLYVTGGYAYAGVHHLAFEDTFLPGDVFWSSNSVKSGWAIGGGLEEAIAEHWSIKAEALYMDFGSQTLAGQNEALGFPASIRDTAVTGRVGVNYRF